MKIKSQTPLLTGILIALAMGGCASTQQDASLGESIDDAVITFRVKAAILGESTLRGQGIGVETHKSQVQLRGFVKSDAARDKAVEMAGQVKGVKKVRNDMLLRR